MTVLLVAAYCSLARGQSPPPTILEIDIENVVEYVNDISDPSKVATNPNVTPGRPPTSRNFFTAVVLAARGRNGVFQAAFRC